MSRRFVSSLLILLGAGLLMAGIALWSVQTVLPAWQFRGMDADGDGIALAETLPTPSPTPDDVDLLLPAFPEAVAPDPTTPVSPTDAPLEVPTEKPARPTPSRPPPAPPVQPAIAPPTRIVIPSIGLDAPVVEMGWVVKTNANGERYSEWVVPDFAAGWHKNSALPGRGGNVVLSGHHNIAGEVFRDLVNTNPGDTVTLYVDDVAYPYVITEKYIVQEKGASYEQRLKNAAFIKPTPDERLTLVTCWPYETNTHRLIVIARPAW